MTIFKTTLDAPRAESRAVWLAALRSDEYKQARLRLRHGVNEFCCLGVAANLIVNAGDARWNNVERYVTSYCLLSEKHVDFNGERADMPESLRCHLGLTAEDTGVLAGLNDKYTLTFREIADALEELFNGDKDALRRRSQ